MKWQFENGLELKRARMSKAIQAFGVYVDQPTTDPRAIYSSTTGFYRVGLPEVVVLNQERDQAHHVLVGLFVGRQLGFAEVAVESTVRDLFQQNAVFRKLNLQEKQKYCMATRLYKGDWDFDALEMFSERR